MCMLLVCFFFFQAEDGIRDPLVTGVQTCALPISLGGPAGFTQVVQAQSLSGRLAMLLDQAGQQSSQHLTADQVTSIAAGHRSEERRVGKSVDIAGRSINNKKTKRCIAKIAHEVSE